MLISHSRHAEKALSLAARSLGLRSDAPIPLSNAVYWNLIVFLKQHGKLNEQKKTNRKKNQLKSMLY